MKDDSSLADLVAEARRLSVLIDRGVDALREASEQLARAENAYRHAKAKAWLTADGELAKERESYVDAMTADLRMVRDMHEGTRQASLEALRSRRAQVSAIQSILAATRSEMEMGR